MDSLDERWREKYYDKVEELNVSEVHNNAMAAEILNLREALKEMREHICDGGGERPCSQMWYQDTIDEVLPKD